MPRIRLRRKAIFYFSLVIIAFLWVLYQVMHWDNRVSLKKLTVNSSMKQFIRKLVPKPKRVLTFEIGRPKSEGEHSVCRFTQSDGLELLAEKYLYPGEVATERKCVGDVKEICTVTVSLSHSDSSHHYVSCVQNPCGSIVKVGVIARESGQIQWEDVNSSKLENFILEYVISIIDEMHPFFLLKCGQPIQGYNVIQNPTPQLILVPLTKAANMSNGKKDINVNILFISSVSRRHFYRSLPQTIAAFRNINLNPKSTSNILDFELYQALGSSSKDAIFGLLSGKSISQQNKLFYNFKKAGYQTIWQDDQCWLSDTALTQSLLGIESGKNDLNALKVKLKSEHIDSLGLSHQRCVLQGKTAKENEPISVEPYCISGRFQHENLLDFVTQSLSATNSNPSSKPLFSLTSISLGQEERGDRIQLLDSSLASFVSKMAADKNTITILLSDHGNTFDMFPVQTMEGQYEQYNPFLFIVLPTFAAWRLGDSKKTHLFNNQIKLISLYDIHNTVSSLVETPRPSNQSIDYGDGLFSEIDSQRNCAHLDLHVPLLCICDGWSSNQQPSNFQYIIAEFALGQLNNMIADQYTNQKSAEVPFTTCDRLRGSLLRNVSQKRIVNGYIVTQMDIVIEKHGLFRVDVKWHGDNDPAMEMALVNYERKVNAERSASCSTYIDRDLCVCYTKVIDLPNAVNWKKYGDVFDRRTKADNRHNHCLYILSRDYGVSTVFEAANMCGGVEYDVRMNFELENMRTPTELPVNTTLPPMSIKFLTFVMPLHLTNPGTWAYEVDFQTRESKN